MFKKVGILTTLLLVPMAALAEERAPYNCDFSPSCEVAPGVYGGMSSPVQSKFNLSIGGYVKLDYAHNTNSVGPLSPGSPGGSLPAGSNDESIFTAKQSRFWLKASGPTFLGAKTNALIEMDFYGAGALSNEFGNARMRHAYGSMDWKNTQVLFGQFWDVFGPAAADTIDFRQGGTTGAPSSPRVPQIRVTHKINFTSDDTLKLVVSAQNPVQDVPSTSSNSFSKYAGTYGSMVNFAGQAIYSSKILGVSPGFMGLGMSPLQLGLFGLKGEMKLGTTTIDNYGYGAYAFVPLVKSADGKHRTMTLSLEGQAYTGRGLDVQGGTNGITAANATGLLNGSTGAPGFGYYGQLKFYPTQDLGLTAGHMRRQARNEGAYPANHERYNQLSYANATYDLNAAVRVATEFEHQETKFGKVTTGQAYAQNNVFRLAAYYFF